MHWTKLRAFQTLLLGALVVMLTTTSVFADLAETIERGERELKRNNTQQALELFTKALVEDPYSYKALVGRAQAYLRMGQHDEALQDLTQALDQDPNFARGYGLRGETYVSMGKFEEARKDLERSLKIYDGADELWSTLATTYLALDMEDEALKAINEALDIDRRNSAYFLQRARMHLKREDWKDARSDLMEAYKNNQNNPTTYGWIAAYHFSKGDIDQGEETLERGLDRWEGSSGFHMLLALAEARDGDIKDGLKSIREAMRLVDGDDPRFQFTRARIHAMDGDEKKARKDLEDTGFVDGDMPRTSPGEYLLGGRPADQIALMAHCFIALDPKFPVWHLAEGAAYASQKRHREALESYKRAAKLDGWKLEAGTLMAHAYAGLEDADGVEKSIAMAMEAAGDDAKKRAAVLLTKANAHAALKNFDGAVAAAEEAKELAPDVPAVQQTLNEIKQQQGQAADETASAE